VICLSGARYKLAEAEYFLKILRNLPRGSDEFIFNLSAFLSACRSAFDVLLYDYAAKYNLGFTLNDYLDASDFEQKARALRNRDALIFFTWWKNKFNQLKNDPVAGPLTIKRHVFVHRGRPPMRKTVLISATLSFSNSVRIASRLFRLPLPQRPTVPGPQVQRVYFDDFPSRDVVDLCEEYMKIITQTISEAENRFP